MKKWLWALKYTRAQKVSLSCPNGNPTTLSKSKINHQFQSAFTFSKIFHKFKFSCDFIKDSSLFLWEHQSIIGWHAPQATVTSFLFYDFLPVLLPCLKFFSTFARLSAPAVIFSKTSRYAGIWQSASVKKPQGSWRPFLWPRLYQWRWPRKFPAFSLKMNVSWFCFD